MADKKQGSGDEPSMEEILSSIRQIISEESGSSGASGANPAEEPAAGEDDEVLDLTEEVVAEPDSGESGNSGSAEAEDDFLAAGDDTGPPDFGPPDDDAEEASLGGDTGMSDPFEAIGGRDEPDEAPVQAPDESPDFGTASEPEPEPEPAPEPEREPEPVSESAVTPEPEPEPASASAAATPKDGDDGDWVSAEPAQQATASLQQLAEASRKEEFGDVPKSDSDNILENMVREALRPQVKAWLDENLPGLVERIVREEVRRMTRKAEAAADPGDDEDAY